MQLDGVMIWVADVPATVAFYEAAFGLEVAMTDEAKTYAQFRTGETTLAFAAESAAAGTGLRVRPHRPGDDPAAVQLAFVHDDVTAAYARAVEAGATAEVPPVEKPWGQTLGYLRDNNGFLVELSSPAAW